jgi:hypothetical protein
MTGIYFGSCSILTTVECDCCGAASEIPNCQSVAESH